MHQVRAVLREAGYHPSETQRHFGPFSDPLHAERCVAALAARPDVLEAVIVPYDSPSEQPSEYHTISGTLPPNPVQGYSDGKGR